jgi:hypothetical protein
MVISGVVTGGQAVAAIAASAAMFILNQKKSPGMQMLQGVLRIHCYPRTSCRNS